MRFLGFWTGLTTLTLFAVAQPALAVTPTQRPQIRATAWQDRDDARQQGDEERRDHDRDRNGYQGVLAPEWQQKFDSYYQRWINYRAANNQDDMRSMEKRMQDIMAHYNIPPDTPYDRVASPGIGDAGQGNRGNNGPRGNGDANDDGHRDHDRDRNGYQGVLAPEWQQKFDSYYQRWINYRATNKQDDMRSMEKRMQDIMVNYQIPADTPYDRVASPGIGDAGQGNRGYNGPRGNGDADGHRDHDRDRNGYQGVLAPEWQQKFDSYYQRWINYRATNNRDDMRSMEKRMQDIMINYNIPPDTPYDRVASPGIGGGTRN